MQINPERLISDLRELATFGQFKTGVNRTAFSDADIAAREWLREKMTTAGLKAVIDNVGNVYGRMERADRAVLIGSHTDTVPFGGWLDGSLGVIYGLEIARCVAENGAASVGVDAISFQDEEGTYLPFLGSRSFCGDDLPAEIAQAKNKDGDSLAPLIARAGLAQRPPTRLDPHRHITYLEAHIEQGPRLEHAGRKIGVVGAIVGIKAFKLVFCGQANHAGTTPMAMRHDAGAAALRFGVIVNDRIVENAAPETVWNIGYARFEPGAANVVPGTAELIMQVRDASIAVLERLERIVRETAQDCAARYRTLVEIVRMHDTQPAAMTPALVDLIERAAAELGASSARMPSGAGHDAMVLSQYIPSAMLFVPSIGGRSHHVSENTSDEDIVRGAQVLLRTIELFTAGA